MKTKKTKIQMMYDYKLEIVILITIIFIVSYSLVYWSLKLCQFISNPIKSYEAQSFIIYKHKEKQRQITFYNRQQSEELIRVKGKDAGLTDREINFLIEVAKCESGTNQFFTLRNNDEAKSIDRGLFAINDKWHPHITNNQAFDAEFSVDYAIEEYKQGRTGQWLCIKNKGIKL